ncbi:LCP family protein [Actinocorallia sp. B10E7]|uniref:LCP family protein n=1 Tax=Actinocorallia sp. B10E7 TaxID=3153558 RepID=UPI00325D5871
MDDLKMLRDLGRDLEHEPPASLVRQRDRMYGRRRGRLSGPRGWLVLGVAAAVTASALLVPRLMLTGEVDQLDSLVGTDVGEDPKPAKDLNILVLGTDQRSGGRKARSRSDTIIVAHIPADGREVLVASVPRDVVVDVPDCRGRDGETVPGRRTMINQSFTDGGVECTRKTVENLAGITLDHTVVFDFKSFKRVIDALGGVEVLIQKDVEDPKAKLRLRSGFQTLNGEQALAYARARYGLGDGSDLKRIERQQQVMQAAVKKLHALLGDPAALMRLVREGVSGVEADKKLTAVRALEILRVLKRDGSQSTAFLTVPWKPAPGDPNRLVLKQPEAERLWQTFR